MKINTDKLAVDGEQMEISIANAPTKSEENKKPVQKVKNTNLEENKKMQKDEIKNLPLSKLKPFENHPFKVVQDEEFHKLVESIKENGILIPAVARPKGDDYELVAGHRREFACRMLGIDTMPVMVRDLTNEQAIIAMCDSNIQRENILPSEKAYAYKMKLEAIKNGGVQLGHMQKSRDILAQNSNDSSVQIQRYIRLTELIPQLMNLVDEKKIAFNPAVELSYLPKEQQELLLSAMDAEQATPSLSQAQKLKTMSTEGKLSEDSIMEVMRVQKCNQKEQIKISYDKVRDIFKKDITPKEMEEIIYRALIEYNKKLIRKQDKGAR